MVAKIDRLKASGKKIICKLLTGLVLSAVFAPVVRAEGTPSLITDAETEAFLQSLVRPIFTVAGVPYDKNKIMIVNDPSLNAFVSNGNYLFVHTGTLMKADNVNQLNGILAHETGHIAGGHIARQKLQLDKIRTLSVASLLAAGAAAAASGRGDAAMAVVLGSQSGLLNSLTAYQLQEERSADESAVRYLSKVDQSPTGLGLFMKKIQQQNRLSGYEEMPYFRTHPLSQDRLRFFEERSRNVGGAVRSAQDEAFGLVKAKLSAFLLPSDRVRQLYPETDHRPEARYAQAITAYRENRLDEALKVMDELIGKYPENPYFWELKGQFLFESGRLSEARKDYERALRLAPKTPDMILARAGIILEQNPTKAELRQVIDDLNVLAVDRSDATLWLLLARAYDENHQKADSLYASAQYSRALGHNQVARRQIEAAEKADPSPALRLKLADLKSLPDEEE